MASKIRFPLKLAQGAEVRTLEELREHFDMEAVLEYYKSGKLLTWLNDRYLEGEAEAVQALDVAAPDFQRQLCEVFHVAYTGSDVDLEEIERRQERLKRLRTITDDAEFIENIDRVAFDQEELADLLDEGANKIYLCGERFTVPASRKGITYEGIKHPTVHISGKMPEKAEDLGIQLCDVVCDNLPYTCTEATDSFSTAVDRTDTPFEVKRRCSKLSHTDKFYVDYEPDLNNIFGKQYWKLYELPNSNKVPLPKEADMYTDGFITLLGSGDEICIITSHSDTDGYTSVLLEIKSGNAVCKGSWNKKVVAFDPNYIVFKSGDTWGLEIVDRRRPAVKNTLYEGTVGSFVFKGKSFDKEGLLFNDCVLDENAHLIFPAYALVDGKLFFNYHCSAPSDNFDPDKWLDTLISDDRLAYFDLKEKQLYDIAILKNPNSSSSVFERIIIAGEYVYVISKIEAIWAVNMRSGRVRIFKINAFINGQIKDYIAYLSDEGMGVIKMSDCEIQEYPYEKMRAIIGEFDKSTLSYDIFLWDSAVYIEDQNNSDIVYRVDLASGSLQTEKFMRNKSLQKLVALDL